MEEWFTPEQKERLRLQKLLLKEIYSISSKPLFKGGTAMELAYGLDRFSEDLDFDMGKEDITAIDEAIENLDSKVIRVENDWESEIVRNRNMQIFMLDFYSIDLKSTVTIKIDVVFEPYILPPKKKLIDVYGMPVALSVMDEREILAEKVNAILNKKRDQPRDLYDLRFLLMLKTNIDKHLIYQKHDSSAFGKPMRYSFKAFADRVEALAPKWEELKPYVNALPGFDEVKGYVLDAFRLLG